jgi:LPS sulfotransferase NodH
MFYLLCTTPRVGSNLLQSLLFSTGVAGDAREFFDRNEVLALGGKHCGFTNLADAEGRLNEYVEVMRANYARGGVFGIKAHFHQLAWAMDRGFDLSRHFPDRFLFLTRADIVAQAISAERAVQTSAWTSHQAERATPRFDPERIRARLRALIAGNQSWEALFAAIHVEPYRIAYEQICNDFAGELERILRFLDVDPAGVDIPQAVARATDFFRVQRDETSSTWRTDFERYLRVRAGEQRRRVAVPVG